MQRKYQFHTGARLKRLRQYAEMGLTYSEVRERENLSKGSLSWIMRKYKIGPFVHSGIDIRIPHKAAWQEAEIAYLRQCASLRKTADEIADELGRTPNAVIQYAWRNSIKGIRIIEPNRKRKTNWPLCRRWRLHQLQKRGMTYAEIGRDMGVTRHSVAGSRHRYLQHFKEPCHFSPPIISRVPSATECRPSSEFATG